MEYARQASQAESAGNTLEAIQLHLRALQAKVQVHGERSVQAAISFNELGDCYLQLSNLEAAEDALNKALLVRDDRAFGGLAIGDRCAKAVLHLNCGRSWTRLKNLTQMAAHSHIQHSKIVCCSACRFDAAVSREYFAQLREAQGRFVEARDSRRRGQGKGQMACGNNKVSPNSCNFAWLDSCNIC